MSPFKSKIIALFFFKLRKSLLKARIDHNLVEIEVKLVGEATGEQNL